MTKRLVDEISEANDEQCTARVKTALENTHNITASETSIRQMRHQLGWKYGPVKAYPIIRDANKVKRVEQAKAWIESGDTFQDVIFSDETTVVLERFSTFAFHKKGRLSLKPPPKHPLKMHVWGAISRRGQGCIIIFEGKIMHKVTCRSLMHCTTVVYVVP
ncbi:muscarinic acetylcholine receptor M3 isoform X2 [Ascaphus truei]|uniref:muscarinic acetylcholine receptor M3 isoform X2 n=1 Tax=Ascaphus truei TaxID=8439 RepID=UPI003F5A7355